MATIIPLRGFTPKIGQDCFLAPNATIVGDVEMGDECSIWFNAVIRGDVNKITIGNQVNIQDGAVIHCTFEKTSTSIGDRVSIGHNAIVHGCTIEEDVLIGMGAIIMDNTVVQKNVIIGAGTIVPENRVLESGFIYVGNPVRKLKKIDPEQYDFFISRTARNYIKYARWFQD